MQDDTGDDLKELIQSATANANAASLSGSGFSKVGQQFSLDDGHFSASPLQNTLLAALAGNEAPTSGSNTMLRTTSPKLPNLQKFKENIYPYNPSPSQVNLPSNPRMSTPEVTQSLQEIHLDSIKCESTKISQVKNCSHRISHYGNLIAVTRYCIAYVLNDKKVRLVGQENGSMGLANQHDESGLPIVDISWNLQDIFNDDMNNGEVGLNNVGSQQQILASLSKGGEVCIGQVYANSSSSLAWEPFHTIVFPELSPARGLVWSPKTANSNQFLAIYGQCPEVYLLSLSPNARTAALTTELNSIEAVRFGLDGSQLFIADTSKVLVISIENIDETFTAESFNLPSTVQRIWLFSHKEGIFAVASLGEGELLIWPFFSSHSEVFINISLPGQAEDLFATFDQLTFTLCVGSYTSKKLLCVNLSDITSPIASIGFWANDIGAISVTSTPQLHYILNKSKVEADTFLYAYHSDSVQMHRINVNWKATRSVQEPDLLPSPGREILCHSSSLSRSSNAESSLLNGRAVNSTSMEDIKMTINKQLGDYLKHCKKEKRENEAFEQKRQQEFLLTFQRSMDSYCQQNMESLIQKSMFRLEQSIQKTCEGSFGKILSKNEKFLNMTTESLRHTMESSLNSLVEAKLLPGLQAIMTDLVGQLSANISQAIVDSTMEQYKLMMKEMKDVRESISELQRRALQYPSAKEFAMNVSQELYQALSPTSSAAQSKEISSLYSELEILVKSGKLFEALERVLEIGDLNALNWLLPKLDPSKILDSPKMTPPFILSLSQQLGYDLKSLTEVKLAWLDEIFTTFDPRISLDPTLSETAAAVLDELFANLRVLFAESPAHQKQVKSVMRLVRLSMST